MTSYLAVVDATDSLIKTTCEHARFLEDGADRTREHHRARVLFSQALNDWETFPVVAHVTPMSVQSYPVSHGSR